jgi:hypothetical protein
MHKESLIRDPTIKGSHYYPPFHTGQVYLKSLPPLEFKLDGGLPLEIKVESDDNPELTLDWEFTLRFGYDDDVGFFIDTLPNGDTEFFVKADFDLHLDVVRYVLTLLKDLY